MDDYIPIKNNPAEIQLTEHILSLSHDCVFVHLHSPINKRRLGFDKDLPPGVVILFVYSGRFEMAFEDRTFVVEPMSLLTLPSAIFAPMGRVLDEPIDAYALYMSMQMLNDINLDLNALNPRMVGANPSPMIKGLSNDEVRLLRQYAQLLVDNTRQNRDTVYAKNINRSVAQAMIYQIMQLKLDHAERVDAIEANPNVSRKVNYVIEFMSLVQKHHREHRSLAFYADKMCISPKYLSRIIKEATKHSAAVWIDRIVLVDAKNMLRFSNRNIQQVAYALNFPSQSSFGKFFKHLTGMSPCEYQQS